MASSSRGRLSNGELESMLELSDVSDFENVADISDSDFSHISENDSESDSENEPVPTPAAHVPTMWSKVTPPEQQQTVFDFSVRNPGPRNAPSKDSKPIAYFSLFITTYIWTMIVRETNKYAANFIEQNIDYLSAHPQSRYRKWKDLTVATLKTFLAICLNMGLTVRKNHAHYWSQSASQYIGFYSRTMPLKVFELISRFLHVNTTDPIPRGEAGYDPWHKIRPFMDYINMKFKCHYVPQQHICLDESMIGMKNRCVYIQYMPNKRHSRFGLKKFELCESQTGYVLHMEIYSGKALYERRIEEGLAHQVVMELVDACNVHGKGYHLFTDNFYTKIPLAQALYEKKIMLTGTIRKNSKGLPHELTSAKFKPTETLYYRQNNVLLVGFKETKTRKPVFCLSTGIHAEDTFVRSKSGREAVKPVIVKEYNVAMGGVDLSDKNIYHISCNRSTRRYWKKIFFNILDMTVQNAYIIYSKNTDPPRLDKYNFVVSIIEDLCTADSPVENPPENTDGPKHEFTHLPGRQERQCNVCWPTKKKGRSSYWCPGCNVGVHGPCWPQLEHYFRSHPRMKKKKE